MQRYYLSFADVVKGKDQFLGACVVEAASVEEAIVTAWKLHINPGGQVLVKKVPEKAYYLFPLNRLMDRMELERYGPTYRLGDYKNN
jgi:hypothetical protein